MLNSLRLTVLVVTLAISEFVSAHAQNSPVPVRIRAMVHDSSSSTLRPVAHFAFLVYQDFSGGTVAWTDKLGEARLLLRPGEYRVQSGEPYAWQGRFLSWNAPLLVGRDSVLLSLNAENALADEPSRQLFPVPFGVGVEPGATVRVRAATLKGSVQGEVIGINGEALTLAPNRGLFERARLLSIPTRAITTLEVQRTDYALSLITGALLGVATTFITPNESRLSGGEMMGVMAVVGAGVGLLIPMKSWHPIPLYER